MVRHVDRSVKPFDSKIMQCVRREERKQTRLYIDYIVIIRPIVCRSNNKALLHLKTATKYFTQTRKLNDEIAIDLVW